jgi:hypothetical protein
MKSPPKRLSPRQSAIVDKLVEKYLEATPSYFTSRVGASEAGDRGSIADEAEGSVQAK